MRKLRLGQFRLPTVPQLENGVVRVLTQVLSDSKTWGLFMCRERVRGLAFFSLLAFLIFWGLGTLNRVLEPARLLCPWDFPGKNTGGISFAKKDV